MTFLAVQALLFLVLLVAPAGAALVLLRRRSRP